jgi:hypothetical protein
MLPPGRSCLAVRYAENAVKPRIMKNRIVLEQWNRIDIGPLKRRFGNLPPPRLVREPQPPKHRREKKPSNKNH